MKILEDQPKEIQENQKAIKQQKHIYLDIYNSRQRPTFNSDNRKTLFNHCSLHEMSWRGLGVKVNAKTAFKL